MKLPLSARHVPTATAALIMVAMFLFGAMRYDHFASAGVVSGLFAEYAFVGIAALGATFVILSGGIDLSVGAMVAFTSILIASLVEAGMHPLAAGAVALAAGSLAGLLMGSLIHFFELPAFMVTLAGMFAIRAIGFMVHPQSLGIRHDFYTWASRDAVIDLPWGASIPFRTMIFLTLLGVVFVLARFRPFGRNVYAIGGNERSSRMMGLPVGPTRIGVYVLAGFCSALAGFVFTIYKQAGDPASAVGLELDVIAAVVIGGTLLSGGVGSILGTVIGLMILGLIRLIIDFDGTLSAAWTSVAVGILLLVFVALQRFVGSLGARAAA